MALIKCEECGREVSEKAATCPGCGASIAKPAHTRPRQEPPKEKKSNFGCLTYSVVGVILIFIFFAIGNSDNQSPSSSTSSPSSEAASDARKVCKALDSTDIEVICKTNASAKRIDLIIYAAPGEAVKMCSGIREQIKPYTRHLDMWKLTLYSPTDPTKPTASCYI